MLPACIKLIVRVSEEGRETHRNGYHHVVAQLHKVKLYSIFLNPAKSTRLLPERENSMQSADTVRYYTLAHFQACQRGVERDGMRGIYVETVMQAHVKRLLFEDYPADFESPGASCHASTLNSQGET